MTARAGLAAAVALAALPLAGCGDRVIDQKKAEKYVRNGLLSNGVAANRIKSVSCPSGVKVKKGKTFDCTATDTSGQSIRITLRMLDDKGTVKPSALKQVGK
jgi:hypothetical protein